MSEFLPNGDVVSFKKFSKNGSTPKLVNALPKNTGVKSPYLTFSSLNSSPAISKSSISSSNFSYKLSVIASLATSSSSKSIIVSLTSNCP